jgi:hypothetical protein
MIDESCFEQTKEPELLIRHSSLIYDVALSGAGNDIWKSW